MNKKDIQLKKIGLLTKIEMLFITLAGFLFIVLFKNLVLSVIGILIMLFGLSGILILTGKKKVVFLPKKIKKWFTLKILLKTNLIWTKLLGINDEKTYQYFIKLNNFTNDDLQGKILVLLPQCLQDSKCEQDLTENIYNCKRCGQCQVKEILEITKNSNFDIKVVGGGSLALKTIQDIKPDGIIAVACERELIDGIREVLNRPVWAIRNIRPQGPCKNTKINIEELAYIMNKKV
ncbi:MAG: DUF116 domain-containing protein [Atribacterota bacterium]